MTPHANRVLVTEEVQEAASSALWTPDGAVPNGNEQDLRYGMVEAVGARVRRVGVGDVVVYPRPSAIVMTVGRREYLFVDEDRLVAVDR